MIRPYIGQFYKRDSIIYNKKVGESTSSFINRVRSLYYKKDNCNIYINNSDCSEICVECEKIDYKDYSEELEKYCNYLENYVLLDNFFSARAGGYKNESKSNL